MIHYTIIPQPSRHIYKVVLQFIPNDKKSILKLPSWIPGSYMIREFSKNIIILTAKQNSTSIDVIQTNKNTWQLDGYLINTAIEVEYEVYALDFGIRTAYLDTKRGYFNNTSLCLYLDGCLEQAHTIEFNNLPPTWNITTGLTSKNKQYIAANYDELIDCPFELGEFIQLSFKVKDTIHSIVLSGTIPANFDSKRFIADVTCICETEINLFGGVAPFSSYTFMLYLGGDIYTGLEHRNSTALMAPYYSLPVVHDSQINDEYLKLLALISHEYFHLWNVKRIRPQVFNPYDLDEENYTSLLWWFEGITSYYDDLILYKAGLIDKERYLQIVLDNINSVYKFSGVNKQSLINSSLTAWIKYYRQDENSPNSIVSYYVKGALVGLCLDLIIRRDSNKSLDDVLLGLYNKWQKDGFGLNETELPGLIKEFTGLDLSRYILQFTATTDELPLVDLLRNYGIELYKSHGIYTDNGKILKNNNELPQNNKLDLGIRVIKENIGYKITNVYANSVADNIGLAANDILLAIDGIKLTNLERQLGLYNVGSKVNLTLFRQEQLLSFKFAVMQNETTIYYLQILDDKKLSNFLKI